MTRKNKISSQLESNNDSIPTIQTPTMPTSHKVDNFEEWYKDWMIEREKMIRYVIFEFLILVPF
jgi:hypothetical protein